MANGFLPAHEITLPAGSERLFSLLGPVFLSLSMFFFGLWLIQVRNVRSGGARTLVWAGSGCLAISHTSWGVDSLQSTGVFSPGWASWYALPVLLLLAAAWWIARRRLNLPGPPRPWLEAATWCLSVGIAFYWLGWLLTDLNWMHGNLYKSTVLTMPWLWAGAFGAVVWSGSRLEMTMERQRIRAACILGGVGGLLALWLVSLLVQNMLPAVGKSSVIPESIRILYGKVLLDRNLELFVRSLTIGAFASAGAALVVWRKKDSWMGAEEEKAGSAQLEPGISPASTSSG